MVTPGDILAFWFEDSKKSNWFNATDAFDADIRHKFEASAIDIAGLLARHSPHHWEADPNSALALILMLDQFPRNMYRGTRAAFAWDPLALNIAKRMVEKNKGISIKQDRRAFIYMPYMHSESLDDQIHCVELVDARLDDASTLHHAQQHHRVIERFGRFPHRNLVLGRASTAEEIAFLNQGGYAP